jgi:hypothetical protein
MKNEDVPLDWGVCAAVSEDCLTLAVGYGPKMVAVGRLDRPIPPREWERLLREEWDKPEVEGESAITRAVVRAGKEYGLVGIIKAEPVVGDFQLLGTEVKE